MNKAVQAKAITDQQIILAVRNAQKQMGVAR